MYKITSEDIQVFLAVGECLNFSEASKKLYITQPAVTKRIHHLERELGFSLFLRNSRTVTFTTEGRFLFDKWTILHQEFSDSIEEAERKSDSQKQTIRIGILYGMQFETLISEKAKQFKARFPDTNFNIQIYNFKEMNEKADELDILFTDALEAEQLPEMESMVIETLPMHIAFSIHHPLARKKSLSLYDCRHETFFVFSKEAAPTSITYITNACRTFNFTPNVICVDNIPSQHMCIQLNQGIGLVPEHSTIESDPLVVVRECNDLNLFLKKVCCWKQDRKNTTVTSFIQEFISLKGK